MGNKKKSWIICGKCNTSQEGIYKKLSKKSQENLKELKKRLSLKEKEFEELRKTTKKEGRFDFLFKSTSKLVNKHYILNGNFEMWLFTTDKKNWKEIHRMDYLKDKTMYFKCKICKEIKFI